MPLGWKGIKPDEGWWIEQVRAGEKFRDTYTYKDQWPLWRDWYRGRWAHRRDVVRRNLYFKMIRTLVPRVYYRNPSVSITPTLPGLEQLLFAKLLERADNKLIDRMGVKKQMKRAVQITTMFGTSIPILGYGAEFTITPDDFSTEDPQGNRRLRNHVEYNSLVHPNTPWFITCHPQHVILPDQCASWDEARWFCQISWRASEDLEDDSRFRVEDAPEGSLPRGDYASRAPGDFTEVWTIHDKKTQQVFTMLPDGREEEKVLLCKDDALQIDGGLPAYPLIFNTDDEVVWGVPDSQILMPQQIEANETRSLIMKHRRASLIRFLAEQNAISVDEAAKLVGDEVGVVIRVNNINGVKEAPRVEIPSALLTSEEIIDREVEEILGLGSNQFGEYAPGSADRSATEASIVNAATQIRVDERRDTCADLLVDMVNDMNHVIMEQWTGEQVMDIIGPDGVTIWVQFTPDMLKEGHNVVKVDPDTSLPMTKAIREQRAFQLYGALRNDPLVQQGPLRQFLLNETYGPDISNALLQMANTSPTNPMPVPAVLQQLQALSNAAGTTAPATLNGTGPVQ